MTECDLRAESVTGKCDPVPQGEQDDARGRHAGQGHGRAHARAVLHRHAHHLVSEGGRDRLEGADAAAAAAAAGCLCSCVAECLHLSKDLQSLVSQGLILQGLV